MPRRRGPTLTSRVGVLEYAVERLQEQQERQARKLAELDRRLSEVERQIERQGWDDESGGAALSAASIEEARRLSRELALYRRLIG